MKWHNHLIRVYFQEARSANQVMSGEFIITLAIQHPAPNANPINIGQAIKYFQLTYLLLFSRARFTLSYYIAQIKYNLGHKATNKFNNNQLAFKSINIKKGKKNRWQLLSNIINTLSIFMHSKHQYLPGEYVLVEEADFPLWPAFILKQLPQKNYQIKYYDDEINIAKIEECRIYRLDALILSQLKVEHKSNPRWLSSIRKMQKNIKKDNPVLFKQLSKRTKYKYIPITELNNTIDQSRLFKSETIVANLCKFVNQITQEVKNNFNSQFKQQAESQTKSNYAEENMPIEITNSITITFHAYNQSTSFLNFNIPFVQLTEISENQNIQKNQIKVQSFRKQEKDIESSAKKFVILKNQSINEELISQSNFKPIILTSPKIEKSLFSYDAQIERLQGELDMLKQYLFAAQMNSIHISKNIQKFEQLILDHLLQTEVCAIQFLYTDIAEKVIDIIKISKLKKDFENKKFLNELYQYLLKINSYIKSLNHGNYKFMNKIKRISQKIENVFVYLYSD